MELIISLVLLAVLYGLVHIDASGDASEGRWYYISKDLLIGMIPAIALGLALFAIATEYTLGQISWFTLKAAGAYVGLRLAFFNMIYNKKDGRPWACFGESKKWDRFNNKIIEGETWIKIRPRAELLQGAYILIGVLAAMELTGFFEIFNKF